ncbi:pyrokinin-1 receptor [Drosophila guanche]|uniref:Blast:Neuromedin-U receptor 2 n=1 Tax=Drosophila guanche TaxID=7266 RepID=A0A3B0K1I2_DROGU|nr:pyrokinin-1 receptor [Drosophila guanche]SPP88094.1 blast:Neuromedin-U receptor 2 [Drosophila guanche]
MPDSDIESEILASVSASATDDDNGPLWTAGNVSQLLGPARDPLSIVVPVTVVYSLIFLSGVVGNISTCIVIKKNRSMHTATNYYLFSLAISDFLLLLSGVPQEVWFIWSKYPYVFGEYFCLGRGLLAETSANATVLTITAFTVERYIAICHPFLGQAMSKLSRAIRIIGLVWALAVLTAIPQAAQFGINSYAGVDKCVVVRVIVEHSFQLSTFIFFFAPMSIIFVLYLLIGLQLYRSNLSDGPAPALAPSRRPQLKNVQSDTILYRYAGSNSAVNINGGGSGAQLSSVRGRLNHYGTRRVLRMLVAVVVCFFICWAPFHAQRLIAIYAPARGAKLHEQHELLYTVMTYISGVLYYLSTCINPLLYNIMSNKFREAFKAVLFGKKLSKGSLNSRHHIESQRLRRAHNSSSQTQRVSIESAEAQQSKQPLTQTPLHDRLALAKPQLASQYAMINAQSN